jgi:hypothetical protein
MKNKINSLLKLSLNKEVVSVLSKLGTSKIFGGDTYTATNKTSCCSGKPDCPVDKGNDTSITR